MINNLIPDQWYINKDGKIIQFISTRDTNVFNRPFRFKNLQNQFFWYSEKQIKYYQLYPVCNNAVKNGQLAIYGF